jgi:Ser/Thr protein kinase RdoA (MazF antagonist)
MGITTYLFHKSEGLDQQRFNMFFLDMGENIHFHYRDLRIELSVGEFLELAKLFRLYAGQVEAEISAGYQDGVLANTNETDTLKTFWDKEKKLSHPIKYHERYLAVEKTQDGYHLHLRNYKLLLSKESFTCLAQVMAGVPALLDSPNLRSDPAQLLTDNELETRLISRHWQDEREQMVIDVAPVHLKKAGQVLKAIGYEKQSTKDGKVIFATPQSTIVLQPQGTKSVAPSPAVDSSSFMVLPEFLTHHGKDLDAVQLNNLKLKILALIKMAEKGKIPPFHLSGIAINRSTLTPTVDFYGESPPPSPQELLEGLNRLYGRLNLFFIKPNKEYFTSEQQHRIEDAFFDLLMTKIACHDCVRRIYVLGSSTNRRSGRYLAPFVHYDWVKLNSDFDIFIELDPETPSTLPPEWEKKFFWPKNGCDYYHFGDLAGNIPLELTERFPDVTFYNQLIEGYLFAPNTGNKKTKDAWLSQVKAQCIFSRDKIGQWVSTTYGVTVRESERFTAASFNRVYRIFADPRDFVLKIYDSTYLTTANREKIAYELELLNFLQAFDLPLAYPVRNRQGQQQSTKGTEQAVLFDFIKGAHVALPTESNCHAAGSLLARLHQAGQGFSTPYCTTYDNKALLHYWLKAWQEYHREKKIPGDKIDLDLPYLNNRLRKLSVYPSHCHGDLSVINYLFNGEQCWLIDFQNIGYGPVLIDLANGMVEFSAGKNLFIRENLEAFQQGYESVRPLLPEERNNLANLLLIQAAVRQAKLLRLHYGGFGYELKTERLLGLHLILQTFLHN